MPVDTFTTPGADTWTCPTGVTSVQIEAWGAGGGGGDDGFVDGGGGGGGGGYGKWNSVTVVPSTVYDLYVGVGGAGGTGGSSGDAGSTTYITIDGPSYGSGGGGGGVSGGGGGSGGTGGSGDAGDVAPSVDYAGGTGGNTSGGSGGGGGSSAGTGSNGNNGSGVTGGSAPTGGGAGGNGGSFGGGAGVAGTQPGGGGGGAGTSGTAAAGGDGKIVLTYTVSTAGIVPPELLSSWANKMKIHTIQGDTCIRRIAKHIPADVQTINVFTIVKSKPRVSTVASPVRRYLGKHIPADVQSLELVVPVRSRTKIVKPDAVRQRSRYVPGSVSVSFLALPVVRHLPTPSPTVNRTVYKTLPLQPPQVPIVMPRKRYRDVIPVKTPSRILPMERPTAVLSKTRVRNVTTPGVVVKRKESHIPAAVQTITVPLPVRSVKNRVEKSAVRSVVPKVIATTSIVPIFGRPKRSPAENSSRRSTTFVFAPQPIPLRGLTRQSRAVEVWKSQSTKVIASAIPLPFRVKRVVSDRLVAKTRPNVIPAIVPPTVIVPRKSVRTVQTNIPRQSPSRVIVDPPIRSLIVTRSTRVVVRPGDPRRRGQPFAVNRDVLVPTMFPVVQRRVMTYKVQCPQRIPVASIMVPPPFVTNVLVANRRLVR